MIYYIENFYIKFLSQRTNQIKHVIKKIEGESITILHNKILHAEPLVMRHAIVRSF